MNWLKDSAWMSNPNVRLLMHIVSIVAPAIVADISAGRVSWLTAAVVVAAGFAGAKAYMENPGQATVPNQAAFLQGIAAAKFGSAIESVSKAEKPNKSKSATVAATESKTTS